MEVEQTESTVNWHGCSSEYETLQQVIVCEPKFMKIEEIINDIQKKYADQNIDVRKAMNQHQTFTEELSNNGIEVIRLNSQSEFPEQVFARDIGFTIGQKVFISGMASEIRQGEEDLLRDWLRENDLPYQKITLGSIEGGDVIVDGNRLFVGVSGRTNLEAIEMLEQQLPDWTIIRVPFDEKYLHLDCVFNILSSTHALVFPKALSAETYEQLSSFFTLIEVEEEEQFTMGTNVLSIGQNRIFSLPVNNKVNAKMREAGFHIIEVDLSEIIKSGGSFRCCTMPLTRVPLSK